MRAMEGLLDGLSLHTICQSALCPNIGQCFARRTATFLVLGDICTRHCTFCAVSKGRPVPPDENEAQRILEASRRMELAYIVITSVTRDDLPDGGASHIARIIKLLREEKEGVIVEVLIPDFLGSPGALKTVASASPQVVNHNVETVSRLYPEVRPEADYARSIGLLFSLKKLFPGVVTKSGLMLGLGETRGEVIEVMQDLREAGCDLLTLGQYLPPSLKHHPVVRFVPPEEFDEYREIARGKGFIEVASAPLVRSSFKAAELYEKVVSRRPVLS